MAILKKLNHTADGAGDHLARAEMIQMRAQIQVEKVINFAILIMKEL